MFLKYTTSQYIISLVKKESYKLLDKMMKTPRFFIYCFYFRTTCPSFPAKNNNSGRKARLLFYNNNLFQDDIPTQQFHHATYSECTPVHFRLSRLTVTLSKVSVKVDVRRGLSVSTILRRYLQNSGTSGETLRLGTNK